MKTPGLIARKMRFSSLKRAAYFAMTILAAAFEIEYAAAKVILLDTTMPGSAEPLLMVMTFATPSELAERKSGRNALVV